MKWTKADQEDLGHTLHDCPDCRGRKAWKKKGRLVHKDVVAFLKRKRKLERDTKKLPPMQFK